MTKYDVYKLRGTYYRIAVDAPLTNPADWYNSYLGVYLKDCAFDGMFVLLYSQSVLVARNVVFKDRVCSQ